MKTTLSRVLEANPNLKFGDRKEFIEMNSIANCAKKIALLNSDVKESIHTNLRQQMINTGVYDFFKTQIMENSVQQTEFFVRQLSDIYPYLLIRRYPQLKFREYVDVIRGDTWMLKDVSQLYDVAAEVQIISQNSGDIPTVATSGQEQIWEVKDLALALQWQYSELKASSQYPRIEQTKMMALNLAFEQFLNGLFLYGNAAAGINGVFIDSTIPHINAAATGTGGSRLWSAKTASQQLQDLRTAILTMNTSSSGVFNAKKVVISLTQYNLVFANPRSDYVDTDVFQFIVTKFPMLESIEGDPYLNGQGAGGTGCIMVLDKDPLNYYMRIPAEKIPMPVEYRNALINLPFLTRTTGLVLIQSQSILIMDGI